MTSWAIALSSILLAEVQRFLKAFLAEQNLSEEGTYFRLDAYFDPSQQKLYILEVTTQYIDGWGIALNLMRAFGMTPELDPAFPRIWVLDNPAYLPEIQLDAAEIALATKGRVHPRIIRPEESEGMTEPLYWYGWKAPEDARIRPAHGSFLEDKALLQRFSQSWSSPHVTIPPLFLSRDCAWDDLPFPVVCKNRRKNVGVYGNVAFCMTAADTGKQALRAYRREEAVAQQLVMPHLLEGRPTQVEILCMGTKPVAGYLLHGDPDSRVLNDRVEHGPLLIY